MFIKLERKRTNFQLTKDEKLHPSFKVVYQSLNAISSHGKTYFRLSDYVLQLIILPQSHMTLDNNILTKKYIIRRTIKHIEDAEKHEINELKRYLNSYSNGRSIK